MLENGHPAALINTMSRAVGLELELSDFGSFPQRDDRTHNFRYSVVRDGSVKPSEKEMVLSPLVGDQFMTAIFELSEMLYTHETQVNDTCGFHVHVNGTDLNYWEIRRLLNLYMKFENDIYAVLNPRRGNSHYCEKLTPPYKRAIASLMKLSSQHEIKDAMYRYMYGHKLIDQQKSVREKQKLGEYVANYEELQVNYRQLFNTKGDRTVNHGGTNRIRYQGLNIHSWMHRGTVEFRIFQGTNSIEDLICWPMFCAWFVDVVTRVNDSYIDTCGSFIELVQEHMPLYVGKYILGKLEENKVKK